MNYKRIYNNLIDKGLKRKILNENNYYEKHHIIPKSIFENNVVVHLTGREHYLAHYCLYKIYTGINKRKMKYAFI